MYACVCVSDSLIRIGVRRNRINDFKISNESIDAKTMNTNVLTDNVNGFDMNTIIECEQTNSKSVRLRRVFFYFL